MKIKDQFEDPDYYFVNELTENIQKAIENLPGSYPETITMSRFGKDDECADCRETRNIVVKNRRIQNIAGT